jgi:hypothetical protein
VKPRPSHEKRRKEQLRKTRQQDKAERRAAKKLTRGDEAGSEDQEPALDGIGITTNPRSGSGIPGAPDADGAMQTETT